MLKCEHCIDAPLIQKTLHARRQVQPLHLNGNHWILASNLHDGPENHVMLYDSLSTTPDRAVKHQVAAVFRFSADSLVMDWPKIIHQDDGTKCGVYMIAYTLALCQKREICQIQLNHNVAGWLKWFIPRYSSVALLRKQGTSLLAL